MILNIDTMEQIGRAIGRMTSRSVSILIASGTTTGDVWLDMKPYTKGIVYTQQEHTGTLYFQESGEEDGSGGGRLGDSTGADVTITDPLGAHSYAFPAAVAPAHYITLELDRAAPNDLYFKVRFKG